MLFCGPMRYSFSNCVLDSDRHLLLRDGEQIKVEPQVFDLLHLLVRNAGVLVTRDQIIDEIWGGRIVSESSISARTNAARKAVGDNGKEQSIVKTIPRRGLQLGTPVSMDNEGTPLATPALVGRQRVRFATSHDGIKIAYATSGSGPKIMRAGHFLTHLEMDWNSLKIEIEEYLEADTLLDGGLRQIVELHLQVGTENTNERDAAHAALKALLRGRDGTV